MGVTDHKLKNTDGHKGFEGNKGGSRVQNNHRVPVAGRGGDLS